MLIRNIKYYFQEAFRSIFRNGWMSFASVAVVTVTLLILGSFMLLNLNVEHITQDIKDQVEIIAYVDEELAPSEVEELRVTVIQLSNVEEVRYVTKDQALVRLQNQLGELVAGYEEEGRNPLRDSFEIRTKVPEDIPTVAKSLQTLPGIARVDYGTDVVDKLFRFTGAVRWVGLAFMGGLAFTAMFLIANTIKLTVNARSKEIMIMKWVGATEWFIRWPFVIEGIVLGTVGALLPALILIYVYREVVAWTQMNLFFLPLLPPQMILASITKLLLLLGITIGGLGSLLSMRRFLKV
ncbi:MAG TPA: permease-like cell division protein FtsX [Oscillospiraceae bacterium]|nr:permease-like cell division protein FtsX [Oscillospiraceae bacterium]